MRTRLLAAACLLALLGCAPGMSPSRENPTPSEVRTTTNQFGALEFSLQPRRAIEEEKVAEPEVIILERLKEQYKKPQDQEPGPAPIEIPRGGTLQTRVQDRVVPLPLKHTDVKAQLTLFIGSVTVTQQYHNPYGSKIEAVYAFPLPDDAGVRDFVMQIGERRIRGIIREREEAKQIYLEARRQGHVASLLTQDRPNIFTQAVANIEPGKQIDVQITYFHTLRYQEGTFEFVFPMVVGPRYNPAGFQGGVGAVPAGATGSSGQKTEVQYLRPGEISAADIALEVTIDAGAEIAEVTSPTHAIRVDRTKVTLSPNDRIPNRDFVLRYRLAGGKIRAALATHRDASGGYFALMIHPPEKLADVPRSPREMIFVIDCSGSMNGRPLEVAKRALTRCLKRLEPDDTFQVLRFSDRVSAMASAPVAATPENVRRGLDYVASLVTDGGTEMQKVVQVALDYPVAPGRFRIVSFMTDGYNGNDREVVSFAREHLGSARIFSFGVGDSVNRYLLEALARVGRGASTFVTLDEATERAADELYQRIEHPALADLRIDWGAMNVSDVQPQPLPDLFVGRPVVLCGRFKGQGRAAVRLSGRAGERPVELSLEVDLDEPGLRHAALPSIWARTKIAGLHDRAFGAPDSREYMEEIRRLALNYGLMSEWTAFVAVDSLSRTEGSFGTTVVQPVSVPSGVRYDTTVEKK
ncbi:MAG TPA: VIT and VWA domain-containing protein [Planctomycetota bacterium]|nr:VIT and VWA domain-containing protein [Planctomycetota bacterium]